MNAPYGLIPIGLFLALLYGISFLFSRLGILSTPAHRKIWNYALLAVFLVTAGLGVLMAVQVNYRLEIPWAEKALKIHVNFGLGMSLIGVFHLCWHAPYFIKRRKTRPVPAAASAAAGPSSAAARARRDLALPFAVGFSGVAVQTLLIREFLTLFEGNELTLSLIVFLWLLLSGAGSLAGARARVPDAAYSRETVERASTLVKALLIVPLAVFPLLFPLKSLLFAPGVEAGPPAMSGFLALLLLPYCFLNGFSFTWTARVLRGEGRSLRLVYGWESVGGAAGGAFCAAAVLPGLPSLAIVFAVSSGLFFLLAAARTAERRTRWVFPAVLLAAAVSFSAAGGDAWMIQRFHPNERLVGTVSGGAGRLTVTKSGDQVNVYENGVLVHASGNVMLNEELAAFALTQTERPDRVLLIGGLLSGLPAELAKYGAGQVDIAEPDPHLFRLAGKLGLAPSAPGIRPIRGTPFRWIETAGVRYDAVLIALPGPWNLQLNRYYTADFFRRVKSVLAPGGVAAAALPGTANYVSESAAASLGSVAAAARESFAETAVFPGEMSILVMSGRPLTTDILSGLARRGIANLYVRPGYFDEELFKARIEQVNAAVGEAAPNADLRPAAYLNHIRWWLGRFPEKILGPAAAVLALLVLWGILAGRSALAGMFIMGAASSGSSVLLLLLIQIAVGALYLWTGLFLGIFMVGLAAGSLSGPRPAEKAGGLKALGPLALFSAVSASAGLLAPWLAHGRGPDFLKMALLLSAGFALAAFVGRFFAGLSAALETNAARHDRLYGYDLLGSALGAVVFPMVVIPLAGVRNALFALALAGLLAWGVVALGGHRRMERK